MQHKLDLVFTGSPLSPSYIHNEVFLLEGLDPQSSDSQTGGLTVHFNVHMDPTVRMPLSSEEGGGITTVTPQAIADVLAKEIVAAAGNDTAAGDPDSVLGDLVIDLDSLEVQGRRRQQYWHIAGNFTNLSIVFINLKVNHLSQMVFFSENLSFVTIFESF